MNGVRVTRDATGALIAHDCEPVLTVRLELGEHAGSFSDQEIVDCYNQRMCALGAVLVASPQLRWDDVYCRWVPRGRAIRCVVEASADAPTVVVDEVELTIPELTAMLASHGAPICLMFLDD